MIRVLLALFAALTGIAALASPGAARERIVSCSEVGVPAQADDASPATAPTPRADLSDAGSAPRASSPAARPPSSLPCLPTVMLGSDRARE